MLAFHRTKFGERQSEMQGSGEDEEKLGLLRCQIQEWYPKFKPHTIRTFFHPLPQPFLRYLLGLKPTSPPPHAPSATSGDSDSDDPQPSPLPFLLPRPASGSEPLPRSAAGIDPTSFLDCSSQLSLSDDDDDDGANLAPTFPELEASVEPSIAALGGAAFPKLNWSAPKDAAWISADGTLRCCSFADVALLLHSSDSIAHDLSSQPVPSSSSSSASSPFIFYLALRRWYPSLRPEMEFRCFVRACRLIAISQREVTNFYPALLDRRHNILSLLEEFFFEVIRPSFGSKNYTFDVYVTNDGRVKLIDFNPWRSFTLPLLFAWEELEEDEHNFEKEENKEEENEEVDEKEGRRAVEFRIVESQCGVRPGLKTAVPYDYLDTGEGSGWDQFLKRADEELRKQSQHAAHDNDDS